MLRFKPFITSVIVTVALCISMTNTLMAQDQTSRNMNNYSCKDIMRLAGSDRDIAISFLHGFILGKKGTNEFDTEKLAEATDQFIEHCLVRLSFCGHER
jgi:hypothetical protein